MPRPLPADYVQEDEEILAEERRHGLSIMDGVVGILILWAVALAGSGFLVWILLGERFWDWVWLPWGTFTVLALWSVVLLYWRMATSRYVITEDRVYKAYGRLRFDLSLTTYDKVTDMHVHQSFFGRIWDFGTVMVETAGSGVSMEGVRSPFSWKHRIERARDAFIRSLVEKEPRRTEALREEVSEADLAEEEPIWTGGPCLASFMAGVAGLGVFVLVMLALGIGSMFIDPLIGALVMGGMVLVIVLSFLGMWIQYRYTRYAVYPDGVVVTRGWLSRHRVETTYEKVTDVATHQDILGRIFNYGRITINTAGSNVAPVVFQGMTDPEKVKGMIDTARRKRRG